MIREFRRAINSAVGPGLFLSDPEAGRKTGLARNTTPSLGNSWFERIRPGFRLVIQACPIVRKLSIAGLVAALLLDLAPIRFVVGNLFVQPKWQAIEMAPE